MPNHPIISNDLLYSIITIQPKVIMNLNEWTANFNQPATNASELTTYNKIAQPKLIKVVSNRLCGVLFKNIKLVPSTELFDFGLTPRAKKYVELGNRSFSEGDKNELNDDIYKILTEDSVFIVIDGEIVGIVNTNFTT